MSNIYSFRDFRVLNSNIFECGYKDRECCYKDQTNIPQMISDIKANNKMISDGLDVFASLYQGIMDIRLRYEENEDRIEILDSIYNNILNSINDIYALNGTYDYEYLLKDSMYSNYPDYIGKIMNKMSSITSNIAINTMELTERFNPGFLIKNTIISRDILDVIDIPIYKNVNIMISDLAISISDVLNLPTYSIEYLDKLNRVLTFFTCRLIYSIKYTMAYYERFPNNQEEIAFYLKEEMAR